MTKNENPSAVSHVKRPDLPELCYVFNDTLPVGRRIVAVTNGERGYNLTTLDQDQMSAAEARQLVDAYNLRLGVTPPQREAMLAGSLFGFDVPGADPALYDERGCHVARSTK